MNLSIEHLHGPRSHEARMIFKPINAFLQEKELFVFLDLVMLHEFIAALECLDPANRLLVFYSLDYQINEPQFGFLVSDPRLSGQSLKIVVII